MDKFRLKLKNGRVIGPFLPNQIVELFKKGKIEGNEKIQNYPEGQWKEIKDVEKVQSPILDFIIQSEKTKLFELNSNDSIVKNVKEVTSQENEAIDTSYNLKEFDYKKSIKEQSSIQEEKSIESKKDEPNEEEVNSEIDEEIDKTRVISTQHESIEDDFDKTRVNVDFKDIEFAPGQIEEEEEDDEEEKEEEIDFNESTQMINANELLVPNKNEIKSSEKELKKEVRKNKEQYKNNLNKKLLDISDSFDKRKNQIEEDDEEEEETVVKKGMKPIVAITFLVVLYFLIFDSDDPKEKKIVPVYAKLEFPIPFEIINEKLSLENYQRGIEKYKIGTYTAKLQAASFFKKSLEYKFEKNKAIGNLILVYSELLYDVKNRQKAGNVLFKLIEISKSNSNRDINIVMGRAKFFSFFNKHLAAVKVIEDFLRINTAIKDIMESKDEETFLKQKKTSPKLMGIYLDVLIKAGKLSEAKKVYSLLNKLKSQKLYTAIPMANFHFVNDDFKSAQSILYTAAQKYDRSVRLLLEYGKILIRNAELDKLAKILKAVKVLEAEKSIKYYSTYLEYFGVLGAAKGDVKLSALYFKKALKVFDSPDLRAKLALLEVGGDKIAENLIIESKVNSLILQSKKSVKENNWEQATIKAIEAVDLSPDDIKARLYLAEIKTKQGHFNETINSLEKLHKKNQLNTDVSYELAMSYIRAYKFEKAKEHLARMSPTPFANSWKYSSAWARLYTEAKNSTLAVRWFKKSLNINPLNDEDYFLLGKLFIDKRRYKKGKLILGKAISLDPGNVEYRTTYAKVLYELDKPETAIGYLRKLLEEFHEDPIIIGNIAIYYYRSGQFKFFEQYRKRLEDNPKKDPRLYRFLIEAARLEDDYGKVIKYCKEYIKVDPGNLQIRSLLGEYLLEEDKYNDAKQVFESIKERLDSYPLLHFYLSKIALLSNDINEAIRLAEIELDQNPDIEYSYIMLGDIYTNMKDYKKAEKYYEDAQQKNPNSINALLGHAWIKFKRNHIEESLSLYLKVKKLDPNNALARKQLGYVYKEVGQNNLAIEEFKVYLELEPNANDKSKVESTIKFLKQ